MRAVGIDFGTTNSAIAVASDGDVHLATFPDGDHRVATFRSLLYVDPEAPGPSGKPPRITAGPGAIRAYLATGARGRLIQSIKAHLGSRLFTSTRLYGVDYRLEDLIALLLGELRAAAEASLGDLGRRAIVGRPVRFAGASNPEDAAFAEGRLRAALAQVGFDDVTFELEPVAAAHDYQRRLDRDEIVLIADFGGGTSDFSLVHLGAGGARVIGVDGVAIAGDAFDARLVRHLAAPGFGLGSERDTAFGRVLPMPSWLYERLERWDQLSFLRSRDTTETLRTLHHEAREPEKIEALMHLIDHELGWILHHEIERTKVALSDASTARFALADPPIQLDEAVQRQDFEAWIGGEVTAIATCVDRLLETTTTPRDRIATVFLTGGSAFVPAVRRLFVERFGSDRLRGGDELTSVARGLALRAALG